VIGKNKALLSVLLTLAFLFSPAYGQRSGHARLNEHELGGFITASFSDRPKLAVQLLSEPGCGGAMLKALRDLGAEVEFAD